MIVPMKDNDGNDQNIIGIAAKLSETPGRIRTPPVKFGESTNEILSELGYSLDDIDSFREDSVI
jgi:formyl-CoA transferase/CoA:oxalate CoA-transferase